MRSIHFDFYVMECNVRLRTQYPYLYYLSCDIDVKGQTILYIRILQ
jgi:hypothetical protein